MISRIKDFIAFSGMTDAAFAKKIGIKQPTLWSQMRSVNGPSSVTLESIAREFPDLNCDWLLRGEGEMLKGKIDDAQKKRISGLVDVVAMQQEIIKNLQEKIKQLQNQ
ncbi:MAG: XRE family transcriptional regulator [Bacteroidales bacterium]|nr:XRE family transcriptional regulator [Bacteroidales bacterium]